ncbi:MAG: TonB-dependent vitamin B12 receptor [Pseudoxanthomonas suwonensis]|nr:TonB-dependent vitamin B12 receptor [Pseudoxanthomonas suwonensis]
MPINHSFRSSTLCLALATVLAGPVMAQSPDADALDAVIVTATRTDQPLAESLSPAEIIDRAQIERSQARDLPELLTGRAGINLANQGGAGKNTTVSMRGTESDHVLLLVDGVRVLSVSAGIPAFQDIPLELIERIEIVRGPRSSLYGSEAIGGVIHVFTRRDRGPLAARMRVGVGSHQRREAGFGIGGGSERGWFGLDIGHQHTDGINACRGSATLFTGCYTDEPDRDGYRSTSASLRGGTALGETLELRGNAMHASGVNEYDGSLAGGNESDVVQQVLSTRLDWTPNAATRVHLQLGRAEDRSVSRYREPASGDITQANRFDTQRDSATLQGDFQLGNAHLLTVGADWLRDRLGGNVAFVVDVRRNTALFAEWQGRVGAHRVQAALRNDDNQQFGNHSTGSIGWGMDVGTGIALRASYGTGFRAPSFNDLYYPGSGIPTLEPERSGSVNLGIGGEHGGWTWAVDAFDTRIDQLIAYNLSTFVLEQVEKARIRGLEATTNGRIGVWLLGAQLSHIDPRNHSAGINHDKLLPRRSRHTARLDLDRDLGAWRFGGSINAASARQDDAANTQRLGGWSTVDLRADYRFHPDWSVQAQLRNIFDRQYETVAWYNQPGREWGLTLRYAPRG